MNLRRILFLTTAIVLTLVILMLGVSLVSDWRQLGGAEQGLRALISSGHAMRAAERIAAESTATLIALNQPAPHAALDAPGEIAPGILGATTAPIAPGDTAPGAPAESISASAADSIAAARAATDDALNRALQAMRATEGGAEHGALRTLDAAAEQLRQSRMQLDRVAQLPAQARAAAANSWPPIEQLTISAERALTAAAEASARAEHIFPELIMPLVSARYAAELANYAARLHDLLVRPLAQASALRADERHRIVAVLERIEQLKRSIEGRYRATSGDQRIDQALIDMNQRYFSVGLARIAELTEAGLRGSAYGVDLAQFGAAYQPEVKQITTLRDQMIADAQRAASAKNDALRKRITTQCVIAAAILALELAVFTLIQRGVLRPIQRHTKTMRAMLDGGTAHALPAQTSRLGEIGALQRAAAALDDANQRTKALQAEREQLIERLEQASRVDYLTQLFNRRAFTELSARQLALARRRHSTLAILLFDADHFKRVNDQHGHAVGDQVLTRIATVAQAEFRSADIVARYGGEEFVALLLDVNAEQAKQLAERLRAAIANTEFSGADGRRFGVTTSIGVACAAADDLSDVEQLIELADAGLYEAKAQGRNRVVIKNTRGQSLPERPALTS